MPAEERDKRHLHNFKHVTTHTAQQWAEFFIRFVSYYSTIKMPEIVGVNTVRGTQGLVEVLKFHNILCRSIKSKLLYLNYAFYD